MPQVIHPRDDALTGLEGSAVPSARVGVHYDIDRALGEGGMGVAFFAVRRAPDGETPVVLKVLRPSFVREAGAVARTIYAKETTALSRLNERVPPTPFVVRLLETGALPVIQGGTGLDLPWLALEYVHGGAEGTTLDERVETSVHGTRSSFDPRRAGHAIDCVSRGLQAVHEVGVLHRDLTPGNVLCCGFGDHEIFKLADFGIARPLGLTATFGGVMIGTPGYAAPEQAGFNQRDMGPWTDVFGLGALAYFVLTGQDLFPADAPADAMAMARGNARPSLRDAHWLSPELKDRSMAVEALDRAIARATSARPEDRPQSADVFSATVLPWLAVDSRRPRPTARRLQSVIGLSTDFDDSESTVFAGWSWIVRRRPSDGRVVRSVSWDGDGTCLAATSEGLAFWNGQDWLPAPTEKLGDPEGIRFVQRTGAGRWLVGGDHATFALYSLDGVGDVVQGRDVSLRFERASGDWDDLAVVVGTHEGERPTLEAFVARRSVKPLHPEGIATIAGLARYDDTRWLIAGRRDSGSGYVALYAPLDWDVHQLDVPEERAFLDCAAHSDRNLGVAGGTNGQIVHVSTTAVQHERLADGSNVTATAIDVTGRAWAATSTGIWLRTEGTPGLWHRVWSSSEWSEPIVSLFADYDMVIGVSATGGVVEGRFGARGGSPSKPPSAMPAS